MEVNEESGTDKNNEKTEDIDRNTSVTSRSGAVAPREKREIYYEAVNLTITEDEIEILERIVEAEVGGDNYNGKLAVANVILNRVESDKFPDTITEVVFSGKQFSPVNDGRYYSVTVRETTKQVIKDALNGSRIIGKEALYFCTPTAPGKGWFESDLKKLEYIAPHNFYGYKD